MLQPSILWVWDHRPDKCACIPRKNPPLRPEMAIKRQMNRFPGKVVKVNDACEAMLSRSLCRSCKSTTSIADVKVIFHLASSPGVVGRRNEVPRPSAEYSFLTASFFLSTLNSRQIKLARGVKGGQQQCCYLYYNIEQLTQTAAGYIAEAVQQWLPALWSEVHHLGERHSCSTQRIVKAWGEASNGLICST